MNVEQAIPDEYLKKDIPIFKIGDTIKVWVRVREGEKERLQAFQGIVIRKRGGNAIDSTFTVRKISAGIGVERIFPFHTPSISKIEVLKKGDVRRSKLYYLRERRGKAARIKEKTVFKTSENVEEKSGLPENK